MNLILKEVKASFEKQWLTACVLEIILYDKKKVHHNFQLIKT